MRLAGSVFAHRERDCVIEGSLARARKEGERAIIWAYLHAQNFVEVTRRGQLIVNDLVAGANRFEAVPGENVFTRLEARLLADLAKRSGSKRFIKSDMEFGGRNIPCKDRLRS